MTPLSLHRYLLLVLRVSIVFPLLLGYLILCLTMQVIQSIHLGNEVPNGFAFYNSMIFYKGRIYLGDSSGDLKRVVLQQVHNGP